MFKKFLTLMMGFACVTANAVPNIWTSGVQMGTYGNVIYNSKNQSLEINCDVGGNYGNGIFYYDGISDEAVAEMSTSNEPTKEQKSSGLSFLLNDEDVLIEYDFIMNHKDFFSKISKAKKIEVYNNNQFLAVFTPTEKSRQANAVKMRNECINYEE